MRLRDILTELEERVGPLKVQAEKAQKFLTYEEERKGLEIGVWLETLERSGKTLREHGEKIAVAQTQLEETQEEAAAVQARMEENFRETNLCTAQMEDRRNQGASLEQEALRADGEAGLLENDLAHNQGDQERLRQQAQAAAQSQEETDREIAGKREEAAAKERELLESGEKLSGFTQRLEELRQGADQATRQLEEAALALAEHNSALAEARIRLTSAESSMEEIRRRAGAVNQACAQAREREQALRQEGEELSRMLEDTEKAIAGQENSVKGYELRLESRRKRAQQAKDELDRLTLDVGEQLRRAKLLEDLERNLEGFTHSVKAVMKEAKRGMLSGVCGPVTQLIHVPKEYAVALETALGGAMQNIVVETEQDAKSAIRFLQKREAGRATFLPLTTIRGTVLDPREMEELPGFVGVASQLCQCEEKFAGIRDSLLGRVAVAEDLDSAVAIAKRMKYRFRIVSLDGQVVNAGGSLTGGARARNSGLLSRGADIQGAKEKAALLQKKEQEASAAWKARQEELSACEGELSAARGELAALQEERVRFQAESARAARELQTVRQELENLERERQGSQGRLAELEEIRGRAEQDMARLDQAVAAAQENSRKLTGDRGGTAGPVRGHRPDHAGDPAAAVRRPEGPGRPLGGRPGAAGAEGGFRRRRPGAGPPGPGAGGAGLSAAGADRPVQAAGPGAAGPGRTGPAGRPGTGAAPHRVGAGGWRAAAKGSGTPAPGGKTPAGNWPGSRRGRKTCSGTTTTSSPGCGRNMSSPAGRRRKWARRSRTCPPPREGFRN